MISLDLSRTLRCYEGESQTMATGFRSRRSNLYPSVLSGMTFRVQQGQLPLLRGRFQRIDFDPIPRVRRGAVLYQERSKSRTNLACADDERFELAKYLVTDSVKATLKAPSIPCSPQEKAFVADGHHQVVRVCDCIQSG